MEEALEIPGPRGREIQGEKQKFWAGEKGLCPVRDGEIGIQHTFDDFPSTKDDKALATSFPVSFSV